MSISQLAQCSFGIKLHLKQVLQRFMHSIVLCAVALPYNSDILRS